MKDLYISWSLTSLNGFLPIDKFAFLQFALKIHISVMHMCVRA